MGKHRDWTEIQKDYQEHGLSYAALARKYGVPLDTLKKAAGRQGWVKGRKETRVRKIETAVDEAINSADENGTGEMAPDENGTIEMAPAVPVIQLYPDRILPAESETVKFARIVDSLLDKVEDAICRMDVTNAGAIKLMTGALKDLRDLKGMNRTALDIEEQKARIEKLRSETRIVEDSEEYGVILLPQIDEVVPPE